MEDDSSCSLPDFHDLYPLMSRLVLSFNLLDLIWFFLIWCAEPKKVNAIICVVQKMDSSHFSWGSTFAITLFNLGRLC